MTVRQPMNRIPPYVSFRDRHGGNSTAGLHQQLGEMVARLPQEALPRDRPSFGCDFRSIEPVPYVDMSAVDRLEQTAADARLEMGEERWAELQKEWAGE